MTGPDLIRLAHELVEHGGQHRLTNLVTAAVHVFLEHDRASWPPTLRVEPDDSETGVGMSDKAMRNPAPLVTLNGERKPLPANGVTDPTVLARHTEMVRAIARSADCQGEDV